MLLDAIIAMFILVVAVLVYSSAMCSASIACAKANQRVKAAMIAEKEIEAIRTLGYGCATYSGLTFYNLISASPTSSPYSFTTIGSTRDRVANILPSGTGSIAISETNSYTRTIKVTVNWTGRTGTQSVSASTQLTLQK